MPFGSYGRGLGFAAPKKPRGPTPYTSPSAPPPGTYDPNLDFQSEQGSQAYGFSAQDYDLAKARSGEDYAAALEQARQQYTQNKGALAQALGRANEDYTRSTGELGQSYRNLATRQSEATYGGGTELGGALAQELQKRTANQAQDQGKLDTSLNRFREDNATAGAQQDQSWRQLVGADEHSGTLGQQFTRSGENADISLQRAGLENLLYQNQIGRAKVASAEQAGLLPTRPEGSYAANPAIYGGIQYGAGTPGNPFLQPTAKPTLASVLASGSLRGTGLDISSPYFKRRRRG